MRSGPNLASRPFVNERPRRRLTTFLWAAALALLALNAFLFWRYATTNVEGRDELNQLRAQIEAEVRTVNERQQELASFDLDEQNEEIRFLNRRLAERTFPWSELFQQLGDVLPRGVRLASLAPTLPEPPRGRRRARVPEDTRVTLTISGQAENGEELLGFLDRMFAHAAFESPNLESERQLQGRGEVAFNLRTFYQPRDGEGPGASAPQDGGVAVTEATPTAVPEGAAVAEPQEGEIDEAARSLARWAPGADASDGSTPPAADPSPGSPASSQAPVGPSTRGSDRAPETSAPRAQAPARRPASAPRSDRSAAPPSTGSPAPARGQRTEPRPQPSRGNASSAPSLNGRGGG